MSEQPVRPYRTKEVAELTGLSSDHLLKHYQDFGGIKSQSVILFPRHIIDPLVYGPQGPEQPLEAVLRRLGPLSRDERIQVAREALAGAA